MIEDKPDARGLISAALAAYRDEILPGLPEGRRYAALMIANALAIADRELAAGEGAEKRLLPALAALAGKAVSPGKAARAEFDRLSRKLCSAIDSGAFDAAERQAALEAYLQALVRERLAISNPKRLNIPPK